MHLKLEERRATRVILIRHGQSTYNALGLYQGSSDESVLTETGRSAACQTGAYLKGLAFDAVYSSSLKRAHQTAREILGVMAPTVDPNTIVVTDLLRETDLPAWQGLTFKYVQEKFAADYRTWKQRPHEFSMEIPYQSFYPALDLYNRVRQFWQEVLPRHIGQTLLLVTHGGTNRALITTALGVTPDRYHCIQQSNCGISVLHFPDGSLESGRLVAMNLTSHVGENLPKLQEGNQGLRLLLVPSGFQSLQEIETAVQNRSSNQWLTKLVFTDEDIIKLFIGEVLGMNSDQWRLQLREGAMTCIHYPGSHHPPILQAMNVSGVEKDLIFEPIVAQTKSVFSI
ncbi:histidine phosphatase family protein [Mastigocladopsis repens]|uniref:histidine phosphatase family protein n=1 Tax=Mastigocladopsis repens TaxID=221287 RepID=UPI0003094CDE|nr:histidine phosphatase family protein [Mastigocladopsis repens]